MYCPRCNSLNDDDAKFCTNCGANLEETNTTDTSEQPNAKVVKVDAYVFVISCIALFLLEFITYNNLVLAFLFFSTRFIGYFLTLAIISFLISIFFNFKHFLKIFRFLFFIAVLFDYIMKLIILPNMFR